MDKHTVRSYDEELNKLRFSVINMVNLVKDLVSIAKHALEDPKTSFVNLADTTDWKINHHDSEIENLAIHILALRQPMAIDLREVISALKLAVILERMGDLSKKISHRLEFLPITLNSNLMNLFYAIFDKIESLLSDIIIAYAQHNNQLAVEVSKQDSLIDQYYSQISDLLEKELEHNPQHTKALLNLILVSRNLERIGDYVNKIASITHFIITGEKLKMSYGLE